MTQDKTPAEQVAADPFWGAVRRRHPDVDIVVLPPDTGPQEPPQEAEPVDPVEIARAGEEQVAALWAQLLGGLAPTSVEARWIAGRVRGSLVRESTWTSETDDAPLDEAGAVRLQRRAAQALDADGWHVLAPPDGLPRVAAGRPEALGRCELLLLAVPAEGRLVLRVRTGPALVADDLRRELIGGESA